MLYNISMNNESEEQPMEEKTKILAILESFGNLETLKQRSTTMRERQRACGCWCEHDINQYADGFMNGYLKALDEVRAALMSEKA